MSIKSRVQKLEQALPDQDSGLRMVWNSMVRRDAKGLLWERPFHATLVRLPAAPNETLWREDTEEQAAFLERVAEAIRRSDPASVETLRWKPDPQSDWTE